MGADYTPNGQLPIPDEDAARDVPYWLSLLASALDTRIVLRAVDAANRDGLYSNTPVGTVVVSSTDGTMWVKTNDASAAPPTWGTVYSPLPLNPIYLTLGSGYQNVNNKPAMVLYNPASREWNFWGNIAKTSGANITALETLATFPSQLRLPAYQAWWDAAIEIQPNGSFADAAAHVSIFPSGQINYYGPDCGFVSLDGIRLPAAAEYI